MNQSGSSPDVQRTCRYIFSGRINAEAGRRFHPHAHASHEVVVVVRGCLSARIGGRSAIAKPGQILWYGIDEQHHESVQGASRCDWHYLLFSGPPSPPDHALLVEDVDGNLRQLTAMIAAAASATDPTNGRKRDALCTALHAELEALQGGRSSAAGGMIAEVSQYIARHYPQPLDLRRLAAVAGMSRAHFARVFKAGSGMSVMTAVRNARLVAARELLLTSDLTLATIAQRVGLGSQPLLSRLLSRHLGVGARALRRGHRRIGLTA